MSRTPLSARRRETVLTLVNELHLLPNSFVVPMRVLQLQRSNSAGMKEVADALSADAALAGKLIGLANSAAYAPVQPVNRLSQALTIIGLRNLMPLVFGLSLAGIFNKLSLPSAERTASWKASLLKAILARESALLAGATEVAEEAFLCGLLQDVALPLMHAADRSLWPELAALMGGDDPAPLCERERALFATDHAEVGAQVAARLGLPPLYVDAVAAQHAGRDALARVGSVELATAADLASVLPHRLIQAHNGAATAGRGGAAGGLAGRVARLIATRSDGSPLELVKRTAAAFYAMTTQFGDAHEASIAFKEFLQELSDQIALSMESAISASAQTISTLQEEQERLQGEIVDLRQQAIASDYDPLTGALNRRGFAARAQRLMGLARRYGATCVAGLVDVDNFKTINDTLGHAAGDRALRDVYARLSDVTRGRGIVGRLGGDEFGLLLVPRLGQTPADESARLAEALRGLTVSADGAGGDADDPALAGGAPMATDASAGRAAAAAVAVRPSPLTLSVGLYAVGTSPEQADFDQILRRADQLMYGAKRSGKGKCVLGSD